MDRLTKRILATVLAGALGSAQVLAQTTIPVPAGPVNSPVIQPLIVQNGRITARMGGKWVPLLDAAGDTALGTIYLPSGSPTANDNSASTSAISQMRLSHVANAAAVATWTNYGLPVFRDDVGVLYSDTGASCTQPDGGWQIQPATGHCWQTDISHGAPIELWQGTKDDATPNQIAANNGINALATQSGGGQLILGATAPGQCYLFTAGVADSRANVQIVGQPGGSCVDRGFASGPVFLEGSTTATGILNKGVTNVSFKHSVTVTSGADVQIIGTRHAFAQNILCHKGSYQCVAIDNSVLTEVNNLKDNEEGQAALAIGCNYPGVAANITVRGGNINYQHRSAIEGCNYSGVTLIGGLNTDFNTHGWWGHPNSGQYANSLVAVDPYFDTSYAEGLLIDTSGGGKATENNTPPTMWVVTCGATSGAAPTTNSVTGDAFATPFTVASSAPCMRFTQGAGTLQHNRFEAMVFNAAAEGVVANGGTANDYGGSSTDNCKAFGGGAGQCSGFHVLAGTSNWTWDGRSGGFSGLGTNADTYGVVVDPGSSDYYVIRGNLSGNAVGPLSDGGTGTHKNLTGVLPAVPRGITKPTVGASPYTYTANYSREAISIFGGTVSSVMIGGTQFCTSTPCQVTLEPNQAMVITYTAAPTLVSNAD